MSDLKPWGRAREMGGGNYMVFEWFATQEECEARCREASIQVRMFPLYLPHLGPPQDAQTAQSSATQEPPIRPGPFVSDGEGS
jgi:hypothetical protein